MNRGDSAYGRLVAMLDDPECGGDILLVGLALLARLDLSRSDITSTRAMGELVWGSRTTMHGFRVSDALRDDIRTYRAPRPSWSDACEAPMIRRNGYCDRGDGGDHVRLRDYTTGELTLVKHCSRHRDWAEDLERRNRAEAPYPGEARGGAPLPAANHGGVLARHFPEIDWPEYWLKLDPYWVEHPEREPRPVPRFSLVLGDDDGTATDPTRVLALVPAGRNA